jgi:hypothetical protein
MFKLIKCYKSRPNIILSIIGRSKNLEKTIELINVLYI